MDFRRAPWKGNLAYTIAPVGKVVETAGVRSPTNFDRPPERIYLDFLPPLGAAAQQKPCGYRTHAIRKGWESRLLEDD